MAQAGAPAYEQIIANVLRHANQLDTGSEKPIDLISLSSYYDDNPNTWDPEDIHLAYRRLIKIPSLQDQPPCSLFGFKPESEHSPCTLPTLEL